MGCHGCDSTKLFVSDCPHRQTEYAKMTIHLALIVGLASGEHEVILIESLAEGILDCAFMQTDAGHMD